MHNCIRSSLMIIAAIIDFFGDAVSWPAWVAWMLSMQKIIREPVVLFSYGAR